MYLGFFRDGLNSSWMELLFAVDFADRRSVWRKHMINDTISFGQAQRKDIHQLRPVILQGACGLLFQFQVLREFL